MSEPMTMLREFHERFEQPIREVPTLDLDAGESSLRISLLHEEFKEYLNAVVNNDLIELADALADMVYVIYGTALVYGIDLAAVLAEVHRSNMTKLWPDGTVHKREDGKILKPAEFSPPRIAAVLGVKP